MKELNLNLKEQITKEGMSQIFGGNASNPSLGAINNGTGSCTAINNKKGYCDIVNNSTN